MSGGRWVAAALGMLFGAALLLLPLEKFSVLLAGVPLALVVLRWPTAGLSLFALLATFAPYSSINLGFRFTMAEAVLGMTWLGVGLQLLFQRQPPLRPDPVQRSLLLLAVFSVVPLLVGQASIAADGNGWVNWVRWLANLSPLLLAPWLLARPQQRDNLVVMLLLGNLAMLLLSLALFVQHRNAMEMIPVLKLLRYAHPESLQDIFSAEHARLGTPWVHPNLTGGAMAMFVPLAAFYALGTSGWRRWLGVAVAVLGAAALLLSGSRGAILAVGVVLAWLAWMRVPGARALLLGGVLLGAGLALGYAPLQARLATMFSAGNASTEVRMDEYRRFPEAMARYPLGIGFRTEPPVPGTGLLGISNLWLHLVYKLGLVGMLLHVVTTVRWWRAVAPRGRPGPIHAGNAIWMGATTALVAALVTGLIDHYYSSTMVLLALFWLVAGLGMQGAAAVAVGSPGAPRLSSGDKP